jgi:hypothetical protein
VDSKNALNLEGMYTVMLKSFREKAKLQRVNLSKLGNWKRQASKRISTINNQHLSFLLTICVLLYPKSVEGWKKKLSQLFYLHVMIILINNYC